ncbi:hypothetical protein [Streptosporangium sp. NPDC002524]|uniref:hypothetical protein n=1 Tax=Streptosporangium sp. NPDC002524 TaxID=3154537 RepID=UPI00331B9133
MSGTRIALAPSPEFTRAGDETLPGGNGEFDPAAYGAKVRVLFDERVSELSGLDKPTAEFFDVVRSNRQYIPRP